MMTDKLDGALAGITQQVLDAAVWQVRFWVPFELAGEILLIAGALGLGLFAWRRWEYLVLNNLEFGFGILSFILSILAAVALVIGIPNTLSALYNPTFWAVKSLLGN